MNTGVSSNLNHTKSLCIWKGFWKCLYICDFIPGFCACSWSSYFCFQTNLFDRKNVLHFCPTTTTKSKLKRSDRSNWSDFSLKLQNKSREIEKDQFSHISEKYLCQSNTRRMNYFMQNLVQARLTFQALNSTPFLSLIDRLGGLCYVVVVVVKVFKLIWVLWCRWTHTFLWSFNPSHLLYCIVLCFWSNYFVIIQDLVANVIIKKTQCNQVNQFVIGRLQSALKLLHFVSLFWKSH